MGPVEYLAAIATLILAVYYYFTSTFKFWSSQGVKGPKPIPMFGNFKDLMFQRISMGDFLKLQYDNFKDEPMIGIIARRTPVLVLRDLDLIKHVLIKDFSSFVNRGLRIHDKVEPLSQHLFSLEAARWRPLRTKLTPTFTSGKLKEMFYLLTDCSNHFEKFLETITKKDEPIECRELTAKFTTDVVGVCAFGLQTNSLGEEDSDFRRMGRKVFQVDTWKALKFTIKTSIPWLYDLLKPIMYDKELNDFFINTITQTMAYRKNNNIRRNDFVDLLRDLKEIPGKVDLEMTDDLITAQAFVFFVAGFETSSTTMSNALYELALNPLIQTKTREELMEHLKTADGKLTYEGVKCLKYLHKVFNETLRKYPPVTTLFRQSMEKYTFDGTNVTIPKDTKVWIPVYAIHRDPELYPDPDTFDPERFTEENCKSRHPMAYMPFGHGPRNCIAGRFAIYQTKIGLLKILQNYKVEPCEKTMLSYKNDPRGFLLSPIGGIHLKFTKL